MLHLFSSVSKFRLCIRGRYQIVIDRTSSFLKTKLAEGGSKESGAYTALPKIGAGDNLIERHPDARLSPLTLYRNGCGWG